jgi:hypothetical protein
MYLRLEAEVVEELMEVEAEVEGVFILEACL